MGYAIVALAGLTVGFFLGLRSKANETHIYNHKPLMEAQPSEDGKVTYNPAYGDDFYLRMLDRMHKNEGEV